jgi:hypothetical protein
MAEATLEVTIHQFIQRDEDPSNAPSSHYVQVLTKQSFDGEYSRNSVIVTLAVALSLYNCLEMVLLISTTFKQWRGLYFWSLSLCTLGVAAFSIGMMLGFFELCIMWLYKTILDIGWLLMVINQSLVLYSRLNLLVEDARIIKAVKWMIIVTAFTILVPVVVLDFGLSYTRSPEFAEGYYYIEQIQMVAITLQELIISALYIWKTTALLNVISRQNTRSIIWQLLTINVIIICMDIAIVALQFLHYQLYQESIKAFVYSVKLKLELNILSKLVDLVSGDSTKNRSMTLDLIDQSTIAGQAQEDIRRERERSIAGYSSGVARQSWFDYDTEKNGVNDKQVLRPVSVALTHASNDKAGSGEELSNGDSLQRITSVRVGSHHDFAGRLSGSGSSAGRGEDSNTDEISQVISSHPAEMSSRMRGRESDLLYADMLRSMK